MSIMWCFGIVLFLFIFSKIIYTFHFKTNVESLVSDKVGTIEEKFATNERHEMPCIIVRCVDLDDVGTPYHIHISDYKYFDSLKVGQKINFKLEQRFNKKTMKMYNYNRAYIIH